eukprot:TRINITY_DN1006_c4_g1_i1.p1 TRINITY_DN1006_c4_g1~~TRINITY_DN1006_c4_g1_i1.p1  ORF type:complete len:828 (+),score=297.05 TRINITY_DN1006_c4_g1_i1:104-2587(+)
MVEPSPAGDVPDPAGHGADSPPPGVLRPRSSSSRPVTPKLGTSPTGSAQPQLLSPNSAVGFGERSGRSSTVGTDGPLLSSVSFAKGDPLEVERLNPESAGAMRRQSHAVRRHSSAARRYSTAGARRGLWWEKMNNIVHREEARARGQDLDNDSFDIVAPSSTPAKPFPHTFKQKVNAIWEPGSKWDPKFSSWSRPLAIVVSLTAFSAIMLNVVMIMVESLPQYYEQRTDRTGPFFIIESVCVGFFTTELLARFFSTDEKCAFGRDPLNIIDLIAVIPYYLQVLSGEGNVGLQLSFLRAVRLVRVLRVLKVGKVSENLAYVQKSLYRSMDALYLLLFLIVISTILLSSAMYLAETASDSFVNGTWYTGDADEGKESKFQSIPHTFWWALVTLCTVGYGDVVPMSPAGKTVAAITMLAGTLVIAFPVILIGANFNEVVLEKQKESQKSQAVETIAELKVLTNNAVVKFAKELTEKNPDLAYRSSRYDTPREVIEGFVWQDTQRFITERWSKALPSIAFHDYDPLFEIDLAGCELTDELYNGLYMLSVPLFLDRDDAQVLAHAAFTAHHLDANENGKSKPPPATLHARDVTYLEVKVVDGAAHPGVALLVTEFHNPRQMVMLNFTSPHMRPLADIIESPVGITVQLAVEEKEGAVYDVTLPIARDLGTAASFSPSDRPIGMGQRPESSRRRRSSKASRLSQRASAGMRSISNGSGAGSYEAAGLSLEHTDSRIWARSSNQDPPSATESQVSHPPTPASMTLGAAERELFQHSPVNRDSCANALTPPPLLDKHESFGKRSHTSHRSHNSHRSHISAKSHQSVITLEDKPIL